MSRNNKTDYKKDKNQTRKYAAGEYTKHPLSAKIKGLRMSRLPKRSSL